MARPNASNLIPALALLAFAAQAQAYSLTAIYDFRPLVTGDATLTQQQRDYPALVAEFEGLTFTQDGSLVATVAQEGLIRRLPDA